MDMTPPEVVKGIAQKPLDGVSFKAALTDPAADTGKKTQFYAMLGTRGIWHEGWFANTVHAAAPAGWSHFDADRWELSTSPKTAASAMIWPPSTPTSWRNSRHCGSPRPPSTTGCRWVI
ncbi:sulfatase family protein [Mycobacterium ulcerans str. Harvey]|uniref:Sulfatase family protein n=1 Tax=Mycobacterium ulcerans str. Harvey TaxID=1299332 RepID=A0ABN0R537_MYCUL|nr:sulfatase family protein [Mycobacterium ulcerans str. Harvey]